MRTKRLILGGFAALLIFAAPAHAGLFGESDEEKAARIHEQNQDAAITDLKQRVQDLEDSLRQATGQNETLAHQVQQLNDKFERQRKDFEYRLCALNAQQLGAAQGQGDGADQGAVPCPGGAPVTQSSQCPAGGGAEPLAGGPSRAAARRARHASGRQDGQHGGRGESANARPVRCGARSARQGPQRRRRVPSSAPSPTPIRATNSRRRRSIGSARSPSCRRTTRAPRTPRQQIEEIPDKHARSR